MEATKGQQRLTPLSGPRAPGSSSGWSIGRSGSVVASVQAAILVLAAAVFLANNLDNNNLWTDESTTLLTVLGFPDVGAPPVSLVESFSWATYGSGDPGGFQVLLSIWTRILGTSIEAIRAMPAVFYLIYLLSVLALGRLTRLPGYLIGGVLGALLVESFTKYYAVELRPYSAALAAAAAIPMAALWLALRPSWPRFLALVGVTLLVGTSSYTTSIAAFSGASMLGAGWWWSRRRSPGLWPLAGVVTLLVTLPLIYFFTGRWQESATSGPGYTQDLMLANGGLAESLRILSLNFISYTALPKTVFMIAVPLAWLILRGRTESEGTRSPLNYTTVLLWIYVITTQVASLSLSAAGVLPWIVGTRWSISEIGIIAVSLVGLTSLLDTLLSHPPRWARGTLAAFALVACAVGGFFLATYERPERPVYETSVVNVVEKFPGRVIVDSWIFSDARYWIEFSGSFESLRQRWIEAKPRENWPPVAVGADTVAQFLTADDAQVMIVRSTEVLERMAVTIPPGVVIKSLGAQEQDTPDGGEWPVAIIKSS